MKIIDDTLKSPNGKYSRKSLTMFVSFVLSIFLGTYIVFSDYFSDKIINPYAENIFFGFLMLSGGTTAMTVYEKIKNGLNKKEENE